MQGSETDELVVEITPDIETPEVETEKPQPKADAAPAVETPAIEPIEDLRKQLEDMKAQQQDDRQQLTREATARQTAEAEARAAREEVTAARTQVVDAELSALDTAMEAAKAQADTAEVEYKTAFEAGDATGMAKAQRKMARAEAEILRLDEGKSDLQVRKTEAPKRVEQPKPVDDPFERAIANSGPKSKAWLRAHPQYVTDQKMSMKAAAAHNMAVADGLSPETDEYIDYCEKFLGLKKEEAVVNEPKPNGNGAAKPAAQPAARAKPMPGAPVSRESVSMSGELTPTQVKLTRGEQNSATDGTIVWNYTDAKIGAVKGEPIGLREMARRKLSLQKQGAYDRSFTEQ